MIQNWVLINETWTGNMFENTRILFLFCFMKDCIDISILSD